MFSLRKFLNPHAGYTQSCSSDFLGSETIPPYTPIPPKSCDYDLKSFLWTALHSFDFLDLLPSFNSFMKYSPCTVFLWERSRQPRACVLGTSELPFPHNN